METLWGTGEEEEEIEMDRDCDKCVYHTSGSCSKWECDFTTISDIRNRAIEEFSERLQENVDSFKAKINGIEADVMTLDYFADFVYETSKQIKEGI